MECSEVRPDLIALVQEELEPERSALLRYHLQSCPACLEEERRILETLNLTRLVRMDEIALSDGLFDRIRDGLEGTAVPSARPFPASRALFPWLAAAAMVLCFAAALTLLLAPSGGLTRAAAGARLAFSEGDVFLTPPQGAPRAAAPGADLAFGSEIRAKGTARLDLDGGMRLVLVDGTLGLHENRARLLEGGLACFVPKGSPFRVETFLGEVRVRGTRFMVVSESRGVSVKVLEGVVDLASPEGSLTLHAGGGGLLREGLAPVEEPGGPWPSWVELLDPDTLLLELKRPDGARPALLEFKITNLSGEVMQLPRFTPDRPRFSLRIRQGDPPRGGVVNLARFRVSAEVDTGPETNCIRLGPGRACSLLFDVAPLLWAPGRYEVVGVYQCLGVREQGLWAGQVRSRPQEIIVPESR